MKQEAQAFDAVDATPLRRALVLSLILGGFVALWWALMIGTAHSADAATTPSLRGLVSHVTDDARSVSRPLTGVGRRAGLGPARHTVTSTVHRGADRAVAVKPVIRPVVEHVVEPAVEPVVAQVVEQVGATLEPARERMPSPAPTAHGTPTTYHPHVLSPHQPHRAAPRASALVRHDLLSTPAITGALPGPVPSSSTVSSSAATAAVAPGRPGTPGHPATGLVATPTTSVGGQGGTTHHGGALREARARLEPGEVGGRSGEPERHGPTGPALRPGCSPD